MKNIKRIKNNEHLKEFLDSEGYVFLLKHSGRCPISSAAFREYQKFAANLDAGEPVFLYLVDVIYDKPISQQIAEELEVWHQSPQIIFVKNKNVIAHFSHYSITLEKLNELLKWEEA